MPNQPDLTELVKHLRTVHFALLLACILTLLPTMAGRRGEVSMAHLQLQEKIRSIRNSWDRWTQNCHLNKSSGYGIKEYTGLRQSQNTSISDSVTLTKVGIRHSPRCPFRKFCASRGRPRACPTSGNHKGCPYVTTGGVFMKQTSSSGFGFRLVGAPLTFTYLQEGRTLSLPSPTES